MKRLGFALLSIALLLFLFLAPGYIEKQIGKDIYLQWMSGQRGYEGVLKLWHVTSFLTASGSDGSAWLAARAKEFEKRNYGLFIEIESMTPEQAKSRMEKGEAPDLWSFPCGFSPGSLMPFDGNGVADLPAFVPSVLASGKQRGEQLALPYMMSGYMLLGNTDLLESRDVELPDVSAYSTQSWDAAAIANAAKAATFAKKVGKTSTPYVGFTYAAGQRIGLAGLIDRMPTLGQGEYTSGEESFVNGTTALCAGTAGTLGTLERLEAAGKGFSYFAEPAGAFTDCVQYIAVTGGLEQERAKNAEAFAYWLLRDKAQAQLPRFGAFPVGIAPANASAQAPDAYIESVKKLATLLLDPTVPNAFAWEAQRAQLAELVPPVLSGDATAIAKFRAIMLE